MLRAKPARVRPLQRFDRGVDRERAGAKEDAYPIGRGRCRNRICSSSLMTVLRDFIDEIGRELDARGDKALAPHHWLGFVKLLADIDQDQDRQVVVLRERMERIVLQHDVRFQDRCLALIPLLRAEPAIAALFNRRRRAAIAAVAAQ